jgi:hypothetical protein
MTVHGLFIGFSTSPVRALVQLRPRNLSSSSSPFVAEASHPAPHLSPSASSYFAADVSLLLMPECHNARTPECQLLAAAIITGSLWRSWCAKDYARIAPVSRSDGAVSYRPCDLQIHKAIKSQQSRRGQGRPDVGAVQKRNTALKGTCCDQHCNSRLLPRTHA